MPDGAASPPRDVAALRELIEARAASLPKRLTQVAEFTIRNPDEIAFGTLAQIAVKAGVQTSTLVRFAQSLGYVGFSEMQSVFRAHARSRWPDYRERLEALHDHPAGSPAGDAMALLQGFVNASAMSLARLCETLRPEALQRAIDLLAAAETIYLLGSRRSFPVATYLAYALRKLGLRTELVDQIGGLAPEQMAMIRPSDVVLAVSFSPYAPVTLTLAATAFAAGIAVVALTDGPFSPLVPIATVWLEVVEADHAAFRSLAGSFALATTLAVGAAERRGMAGDV